MKSEKEKIQNMVSVLRKESQWEIPSDVLGSYTGTSVEQDDPEQDADDL